MKLRQLRYLCEIERQGFNISAAAKALHTAQPGISKQIRLLEQELGVEIFTHRSGRITGLTEAGVQIVNAADQLLRQSEHVTRIAQDFVERDAGELTIAATYTIARYMLPPVLKMFVTRYPKVRIALLQGDPSDVTKLVASGSAELSFNTKGPEDNPHVTMIEFGSIPRTLLMPLRHPLGRVRRPTLASIAKYPLIVPHVGSLGHETMRRLFRAEGLEIDIRMSAVNVDLAKALVESDLGVAILPRMVYDPTVDKRLAAADVNHLFPPHVVYVTVRNHHYLRGFGYDFISMVAPDLTRQKVEAAIFGARRPSSETANGGRRRPSR